MPGEKMYRKTKQRSGMTLGEVVVSVAIIAAMIAVTIPTVEILRESFHSSGAKTMISSALSAARALAAMGLSVVAHADLRSVGAAQEGDNGGQDTGDHS